MICLDSIYLTLYDQTHHVYTRVVIYNFSFYMIMNMYHQINVYRWFGVEVVVLTLLKDPL